MNDTLDLLKKSYNSYYDENFMKEFIEYIIKNLVDEPDAVSVKCYEGDRGIIAEVSVDQKDVGKVVGKGGKTINALRTVAMMACARIGRRIRIELIESPKEEVDQPVEVAQVEAEPAEELAEVGAS